MDYKYIRAWGKIMSHHKYLVLSQVEKALAENAPADAIYRQQDGTWVTLNSPNITTETKFLLNLTAKELEEVQGDG
ncbi:MAG TPA: hypothetical protein VIY48_10000 [Candidatus Paceibacterota bacterium]